MESLTDIEIALADACERLLEAHGEFRRTVALRNQVVVALDVVRRQRRRGDGISIEAVA